MQKTSFLFQIKVKVVSKKKGVGKKAITNSRSNTKFSAYDKYPQG